MAFLRRLFFPPPSLAVVFVAYGRPGHDPRPVLDRLCGYLAPLSPTVLMVDNGDEALPLTPLAANTFAVGGDNRFREFSGWQRGIDLLPRVAPKAQVLLLANDMFEKPGPSFLRDYATPEILRRVRRKRQVIGRIDTTGHRYRVFEHTIEHWVCTNAFFLPRQAPGAIGGVVSVGREIDRFLPASFPGAPPAEDIETLAAHFFHEDAPISPNYRCWLVEWLTRHWHSRFLPDQDTWDIFRNKVRNILNEALLTARLQAAGFAAASYGDKKYY